MSTLKRQVVEGVDIMVVREVSGGALSIDENTAPFGENESEAFSSIKYKDSQVYRIMEIAASIASRRSGRICNVDKAVCLLSFFVKEMTWCGEGCHESESILETLYT
jgi:3-isopropylmalate dehydrogenase